LDGVDLRHWKTWASLAVIAVVAAWAAFTGIEVRDFSGDELARLGHTAWDALDRSLGVNDPEQFGAHLPLAWALRAIVIGALGADQPLAWRLHAAAAACLGALLTWVCLARRCQRRTALAAGLAVALAPMLSYHAHDSNNYALGPLTGLFVLAGLADLARGRRPYLLAAGLLLGAINDYFFAYVAGAALVATPLMVRMAPHPDLARRQALITWGGVCAALAVPAAVLVVRLLGTPFAAVIEPHADPAGEPLGLLAAVIGHVATLATVYAEGYACLPLEDPWMAAGPLALLTAGLVAALRSRDPLAVAAALLLVVAVGGSVLFAWGFTRITDREFPVYPRAYMALLPALVVVWLRALTAAGWRAGVAPVAALLLLTGTATLRQVSQASDTQAWSAHRITELWQPGDLALAGLDLRFHLPSRLAAVRQADPCLPGDQRPARVWVVAHAGGAPPDGVSLCADRSVRLLDDLGYRLRLHEIRAVPPHEQATNAFLAQAWLYLFDRAPAEAGEPREYEVAFDRALLDGAAGSTTHVTWMVGEDHWHQALPFADRLAVGRTPADRGRLRVSLTHGAVSPADTAQGGLLAPLRAPAHTHPPVPVLVDPLEPRVDVRLTPLGSPVVQAGRRVVSLLVGLAAVVLVGVGWRRLAA